MGGWLILEKWMTPSLFAGTDAVDEYTFMQTNNAAATLKRHRDTFITESDFKWLHDTNLNAVRLPVGYWIIDPESPYLSGIEYVDWAFRMAEKYDLKILLDLHGAPGSQNGNDHSGRIGKAAWFDDELLRRQTLEALQKLHERYKNSPSYWGIELLNEPRSGWLNRIVKQFYRIAVSVLTGQQKIVFHDAYRPRLMNGTLSRNGRAVMDIHLYHMASWLARYVSAERFVQLTYWWWGRLLRKLRKKQPVIIGEWSIVLKADKLAAMPADRAVALVRTFGSEQLKTYEQYASGWFYWNYKTEEKGWWNFRWLVESKKLVIPKTKSNPGS